LGGNAADTGTCVALLVVGTWMVAVVTGVNRWAADVETGATTDVEVGGTNNGTVVVGA
jgi:hypothetical protein